MSSAVFLLSKPLAERLQNMNKALSMENIIGGFRVTGVFPFERSVIKRLIPSEEQEDFLSFKHETRLAYHYVPLYSPVCSRSSHISTDHPVSSTPY